MIDGPAGLRKGDIEELVAHADLIVMPVLPSTFDQNASEAFLAKLDELKPIRKNRKGGRRNGWTASSAGWAIR